MSILKYDSDCTTWSPQGKLLQVTYAEQAVKNGSICLALRSKTSAVLLSVKKNPTKLATYQEKLFKISKSVGIGISGMTADARVLCKYLRKKNTENHIKYGEDMSIGFLSQSVAKKFRSKTYASGKRPFGVGLLLVGFDLNQVPHVYELGPGGDCIEYESFAIGAKSQSAKTYFENHLSVFKDCSDEDLIAHGLRAISSGYKDEKEDLSEKNLEISLLNKSHGY
jgi:20S proteasome subunit alpha 6